jgi:RNA polymerase-associated protein
MTATVLLYEHPLSSYAQKIKIALREKGVTFNAVVPDDFGTGRRDTPLSIANPRAEVPVLIVNGTSLFDSTIIMEFIDEHWSIPALLPRDHFARAKAREIKDICDTQYEAVNWGYGELLWFNRASGELAKQLKDAAARDTNTLQEWLTDQLGDADWFGGDGFGWADAAVALMVNRSVHYGLAPAPDSTLGHWHRRVAARHSVATTFAEFDNAAIHMAAASGLYVNGTRRREYRDHRLEWMIRSGGLDVVKAGIDARNIRFSWPST